jgi:hypothetical protein
LELIAKENGYSNWKHCLRELSKQPVHKVESAKERLELSFTDWLRKHKNRDSPLGDLATDAMGDKTWPSYNTLDKYRNYLHFRHADLGAIEALERAWKSYKTYLKRKKRAIPNQPKFKKPIIHKHDPRKIVYVSNIIPLHYTKRTVEQFDLGAPAWISWDGRKAIPVKIAEVDDRHYTVRIERPLNKAGSHHSLFLDEVRSTPDLACLNCVTS